MSNILYTVNGIARTDDQQGKGASRRLRKQADFQRIVKGQKINMNIPVHFTGREEAPGTKAGGILSTLVTDIEIVCLPQDLPEYLEVDVSALEIGESLHLTDIKLPEGVIIFELDVDEPVDRTVVNMQAPTVEEVDEDTEEEVDAADVPATEQGAEEDKGEE